MFRSSEHVPNSTLSISKCMYIFRWVIKTLPLYCEMRTWLCFASQADSAKRLKSNKLTSLKATLVRNYDPPTDRLTGESVNLLAQLIKTFHQ